MDKGTAPTRLATIWRALQRVTQQMIRRHRYAQEKHYMHGPGAACRRKATGE